MSEKFTPGPWSAEAGAARGAWIKGADGNWSALACGEDDETAIANRDLIAAAPELYEAAESVIAFAEVGLIADDHPRVVQARAALALARGETA